MRMIIRDVSPEDADRLLEIYSYYVKNTAITFEWAVPTLAEFRQRIERTLKKYPYLAAEENGRIIGYAYAGPFVGRTAYDWSAELSIYIDAAFRRCGTGKLLYQAMENRLRQMNIINLYACIGYPETEDEYLTRNSAQFHKHMGYQLVGRFTRCGFKFGRWYDMIWMEKMLGPHPDNPPKVVRYSHREKS
jgi:L-amino acid N-acyltransferase YncA